MPHYKPLLDFERIILEMHHNGETNEYIGSKLGRSPIIVYRYITAHTGVTPRIGNEIEFGAKEEPYYQSEEEIIKHSKIRWNESKN